MARWEKNPNTNEFELVNDTPPADEVVEFRKYHGRVSEIAIPEKASNRRCTDVFFFAFFVVFFAATLGVIIANTPNIVYKRFTNGYLWNGDVCGIKNKPMEGMILSGADYSDKPLTLYDAIYSTNLVVKKVIPVGCTDECPFITKQIGKGCYPALIKADITWEVWVDILNKAWLSILVMNICAVVLTVIVIFCFKWNVRISTYVTAVVGILLMAGMGIYILTTCTLHPLQIFFGAFFIALALILAIYLMCIRDQLEIVFDLFEEAISLVSYVPCLVIQPVLTALFNIGTFVAAYYTISALTTVVTIKIREGRINPDPTETFKSTPTGLAIAGMILGAFFFAWFISFTWGCQIFVTAYAIISVYFRRDRGQGSSPVCKGYGILMRFHLGTIACGSLVITLIQSLRYILRAIRENSNNICTSIVLCCIECCLICCQEVFEYFSKNAYIMTAMHGQSFCKSGMRAFRLLAQNLLNCLTVHVLGEFIVSSAIFFIFICSFWIGFLVNYLSKDKDVKEYTFIPLLFGSFICWFLLINLSNWLMTVIDTVFLCFCEDKMMSDSGAGPHYMSPQLRQHMDNTLEYEKRWKNERKSCWC